MVRALRRSTSHAWRGRTLWDALNSFIHGGIHPFHRGKHGYPLPLLRDVLKNSNAISMSTLLLLAEIAGRGSAIKMFKQLHQEFGDVLPGLLPALG